MQLHINNAFTKSLPADEITDNYVRQVKGACFSFVNPTPCTAPVLLHFAPDVAENVGIDQVDVESKQFLDVFSGNEIYPNSKPYAMCYGGHQFGHWAGQLGDGRAINLFETVHNGKPWTLQLKGAGLTPYSRHADGLAVLRSSVREYLCSEAMYHLGVPTTRALCLVSTGDQVLRDVMYNGNAQYEKGAIVCRVAPSFIRFGNFQILAANGDIDILQQLVDYTITNFFPHLGAPNKESYIQLISEVADRTINMIVEWERVGFVHGVMNTDNMSILGLTIDYGPYGWIEDYNPDWTPNTTDAQDKRYRFGNQANIAIWNLYQLANAIYPIINEAEPLENILGRLRDQYETAHYKMMLKKLGLEDDGQFSPNNLSDFEHLLTISEMDMTLFFRNLAQFNGKNNFEILETLSEYSYSNNFDQYLGLWSNWLSDYGQIIISQNLQNRTETMNATNPKYVLRNYMAQIAIDAADKGDYSVIDELYQLLTQPYAEQNHMSKWASKRPEWALNKVGCSMLSCSS